MSESKVSVELTGDELLLLKAATESFSKSLAIGEGATVAKLLSIVLGFEVAPSAAKLALRFDSLFNAEETRRKKETERLRSLIAD